MNFDDLIQNEQIKKESGIGFDQAYRLLEESKNDLKTAHDLLEMNQSLALQATYTSMFHAANALLRSLKLRPGRVRQHMGVVAGVERALGDEETDLITRLDNLRGKRNNFEYQAIFTSSKTEIKNSFKDAEKFIEIIEKFVNDQNPQKRIV